MIIVKKIVLGFCAIIIVCSCAKDSGIVIEFIIEGHHPSTPLTLSYSGNNHIITLDELGTASFFNRKFSGESPAILQFGKFMLPMYLKENHDFQVYINLDSTNFGAEFYGKGALLNEILNGKYLKTFSESEYIYSEATFLRIMKRSENNYMDSLEILNLNEDFINEVLKNNYHKLFASLAAYPEKHKKYDESYSPSEEYINFTNDFLSSCEDITTDLYLKKDALKWSNFLANMQQQKEEEFAKAEEAKRRRQLKRDSNNMRRIKRDTFLPIINNYTPLITPVKAQ
ncbi:MAG: hypothetical protein LBM07_04530 [Culturomica sp.]|jgi:hypothetical protein|nr:hypothetical protein [Culturomica sp.]